MYADGNIEHNLRSYELRKYCKNYTFTANIKLCCVRVRVKITAGGEPVTIATGVSPSAGRAPLLGRAKPELLPWSFV